MMIALIPTIHNISSSLPIHTLPRSPPINPVRIPPHTLINNSKVDFPTDNLLDSFHKSLVPGLVIQKRHGIVVMAVGLRFQRFQRHDCSIDVGIARQHEDCGVFSPDPVVAFLAAGEEGRVEWGCGTRGAVLGDMVDSFEDGSDGTKDQKDAVSCD